MSTRRSNTPRGTLAGTLPVPDHLQRLVALISLLLCSTAALSQTIPNLKGGPTNARPIGDPQPSPETYTLEQVGAWGGEVGAFTKVGDIGYLGSGQRLIVLNMSDLRDMREIAHVRMGTTVRDIKVRDGYAYVVTEGLQNYQQFDDAGLTESSFHVVDIHIPTEPQVVWSNSIDESYLFNDGDRLELYGDLAFLVNRSGGCRAADLSNPAAPVFHDESWVNFYHTLTHAEFTTVNGLSIQDNYIFVADSSIHLGHLHVYNLESMERTFPLEPKPVASLNFTLNREVTGVAVDGDWAYVSVIDNSTINGNETGTELWAVSISDLGNVHLVGTFDDFIEAAGPLFDFTVSNGRLYVANTSTIYPSSSIQSLMIFDVGTNPALPDLIGSYQTHGSVFGVEAEGDIVYLLDAGEGLIALDTKDPDNIVRLGNYHSPATPGVMRKQGDLMYIADYWNGMTIVDVSDKANPEVVGVYQTDLVRGIGNKGLDIDNEGLAYLAVGYKGLDVIDVSDPSSPFRVGHHELPLNWQAHAVRYVEIDDRKYAIMHANPPSGCYRILSLDVTDPAQIALSDIECTGIIEPVDFARGPEGILYHITRLDGRHVAQVDYSDPNNLSVTPLAGSESAQGNDVTSAVTYDPATQVVWYAAKSSVSDGLDHLYALDVSDPNQHQLRSETGFDLPGALAMHPMGLVMSGKAQEFLSMGLSRTILMDVSDPSLPTPIASAVNQFPFSSLAGGEPISFIETDERGIYVSASFDASLGRNAGIVSYRIRSIADRDGDDQITTRDLLLFLGEFSDRKPIADLNEDGAVNYFDLQLFTKSYLAQ